VLRCTPLHEIAPHVFTTRDLGLGNGSDEWDAVAREIGVEPRRLRLIRQVHGTGVAVARRGDTLPWTRPEADVIISDDPASAIGVRVADCAPVLLADRRQPVVAAVHAGWRGTLERASAAAVLALQREFGTDPSHLVAAIGPSLGPCCGEMGPEVVEAFRSAGHDASALARWFQPGPNGRPHLDLWQANRDQLEAMGIPPASIFVAGLCSKTHADRLHSYRAHGARAGRMVGLIRPCRA
jgi:YfiH family protein